MRNFLKILTFGAVFFIGFFTSNLIYADNLLVNPGFESGLTNWVDSYGDPSWLSTSITHSGSYAAAKTIGEIPGQDYWSQITQAVAYQAGADVYATMWVKSDINVQAVASCGMLVEFLDSNGQVIPGGNLQGQLSGQTGWQQLYISGTSPTGTVSARFSGFVWAQEGDPFAPGGNAYFDDAVLDTDYIPPPPPPTVLQNPGFEQGLNFWHDLYGQPSTLSSTVVHSGVYSAQKTIPEYSGQDYWSQLYQEVTYDEAAEFYATMWVKTNISPAADVKAGVRIEFLDANNEIIPTPQNFQDQIGGQTDWRLLYVSGTTPTGTVRIRFSAYIWAAEGDAYATGGIAYYDDAVFISQYIEPPPLPSSLINSGFENGLNDWNDQFGYSSWLSTTIAHSGNYAAAKTIEDVSGPQNYFSKIYQELAVPTMGRFGGLLWVKTNMNPHSSAKGGILLQFFNSAGVQVGPSSHSEIAGQSDWRRVSITGIIPTGAVSVRVNGFVWAQQGDLLAVGAIAYFDDAVFMTRPLDAEDIDLE